MKLYRHSPLPFVGSSLTTSLGVFVAPGIASQPRPANNFSLRRRRLTAYNLKVSHGKIRNLPSFQWRARFLQDKVPTVANDIIAVLPIVVMHSHNCFRIIYTSCVPEEEMCSFQECFNAVSVYIFFWMDGGPFSMHLCGL